MESAALIPVPQASEIEKRSTTQVYNFCALDRPTQFLNNFLIMGNSCCKPEEDAEEGSARTNFRRPRWRSGDPLSEEDLERMRAQFWDTEPHYGGDRGKNKISRQLCARVLAEGSIVDSSLSARCVRPFPFPSVQ